MPVPPTVVVYSAFSPCLREILAGLEEEGVPAEVSSYPGGDAVVLAFAAALASPLDVGIGVGDTGTVCVHHAKLPQDEPALTGPAGEARRLGHNAARLVTRIPLKTR
ncbi:hypothetical protein FPZ12_019275 [Amycolatopsis acidicola]|uniref:PduH protein n=1 Tax=Amycolatopsis acidicola TaxID=2596893 RepID=A0A5N0V405_9PSEU|nr:glycerol dehydratase reactivase beta/small subunit family protein [Amycolatopsis acidicola]KAA9159774.1 hypothetical protein FPZ12_019275 [Amycolatopsis acidicola]